MNFKQAATFVGLMASSAIALSTAPAQAFNFASGNLSGCTTGGTSCTTSDGFTITASGGNLNTKELNGVTGVGIGTAAPVVGEIDTTESMNLLLPGGSGILRSLDLGFMYQPGVFEDLVWERAIISAGNLTGYLTVESNNTARWQVAGLGINTVVTAMSPSTSTGGGWYSILNPFASSVVSSVTLQPYVYGGFNRRNAYKDSDFSLVGAQVVQAVPEPTTLAGVGIVGGLLMASRRRKSKAVSY